MRFTDIFNVKTILRGWGWVLKVFSGTSRSKRPLFKSMWDATFSNYDFFFQFILVQSCYMRSGLLLYQMGLSRVKDIHREIFELCNMSLYFCLFLWVTHNQQSQEAIWQERRKRQAHHRLVYLDWIFKIQWYLIFNSQSLDNL